MDIAEIRSEVRRLAPWYYRFDLPGISTAEVPAVDNTGHREIVFPDVRPGFWEGASVLDVGCAEGAWSFGALERGAARVTAFDCRRSHIEKARFIANVRGHSGVEFEVGSCDRWLDEHAGARYDVVTFCGIIPTHPLQLLGIAQWRGAPSSSRPLFRAWPALATHGGPKGTTLRQARVSSTRCAQIT